MSVSVVFRKIANFLDDHPQETAPFVVVASANLVSFGATYASVDQVDDLLTLIGVGGVWERHCSDDGSWWIGTEHTTIGPVRIYAPGDVLDTVINALPEAWVAS